MYGQGSQGYINTAFHIQLRFYVIFLYLFFFSIDLFTLQLQMKRADEGIALV